MSEDLGSSSVGSHIAMQMATKPGAGATVGGGGDRLSIATDIGKTGGSIDMGIGGNISDNLIPHGGALSENVFNFADRMGDTLAPFKFSETPAMPSLTFEHADLSKTSFQENTGIGITGKTSIANSGQGH